MASNKKSNVVHFRKKRKPRSNFNFLFGELQLEYASKYKYLGMHLNEYLNFSVLADASSRTVGGIIGKLKELKNVTLKVFESLYNSGVCPIMDYSASFF